MTYRGTYRDGVIVLSGDVDLHNGESVRVSRDMSQPKKRGAKKKTKVKRKAGQTHPVTKLAGIWKDRQDWRGLTSSQVLELIRSGKFMGKPEKKRKPSRG